MAAQCRSRLKAEDEVETIRPAEVDDLGAAIVAVGANENVHGRPVGLDRPKQTPKELAYFYAARTLGRAQHGGHDGVEGIVEVKHDPLGNSGGYGGHFFDIADS
jgi:hypothetical protein